MEEYENTFLYPSLISNLSNNDIYNLKVSTAVLFLPADVKSLFYIAMNENKLNEHLMLGCLMKYVLLEENSDILDRLDKSTKSVVCAHLNIKIKDYIQKEYPEKQLHVIF